MPWCGYWGTAGSSFWWALPLIGLVVMAVMLFACSRRLGCMPGRRRASGELLDLHREVDSLKEDVRKLVRPPK